MRKNLRIEDINLSKDNPRNTESESEEEAFKKLIESQNRKLYVLASDIVTYGINPLETIGVFPSDLYEGKYIVAEGNRRVAAIKMLDNPEKIKKYDTSLYNKFLDLSKDYKKISTVEAFLFRDEYASNYNHWMEIKHLGEQGGKGISPWGGEEKARYEKKKTGSNILIDFWEELEDNDILSKIQISRITKTNWERILRDIGLRFLGIKKRENKYEIPKNDRDEFKRKMQCVYKRLANKTVALVYDQERIINFFDEISIELYGYSFSGRKKNDEENTKSADSSKEEKNKSEEEKGDNEDNGQSEGDSDSTSKHTKEEKSKKRDYFQDCKTIIPKKYDISSDNARINRIIKELKELNADVYPNACGILLRVLFELSTKYYNEKDGTIDKTKEDFQPSVMSAANDLVSKGVIDKSEHSALSKEIDTLRKLFNGYMHNTDSYPSPESIKCIFKAHKKFLKACLE